jgi:hypothetical protein
MRELVGLPSARHFVPLPQDHRDYIAWLEANMRPPALGELPERREVLEFLERRLGRPGLEYLKAAAADVGAPDLTDFWRGVVVPELAERRRSHIRGLLETAAQAGEEWLKGLYLDKARRLAPMDDWYAVDPVTGRAAPVLPRALTPSVEAAPSRLGQALLEAFEAAARLPDLARRGLSLAGRAYYPAALGLTFADLLVGYLTGRDNVQGLVHQGVPLPGLLVSGPQALREEVAPPSTGPYGPAPSVYAPWGMPYRAARPPAHWPGERRPWGGGEAWFLP